MQNINFDFVKVTHVYHKIQNTLFQTKNAHNRYRWYIRVKVVQVQNTHVNNKKNDNIKCAYQEQIIL